MKITKEWLEEKEACIPGKKWFDEQEETDGVALVRKLIGEKRYDWANWLLVRIMGEKDSIVRYALYAAEESLPLYEAVSPGDLRPRMTMEAIKTYQDNPTPENLKALKKAINAAYTAAEAAAAAAAYAAATAYATYAVYLAASAADAAAVYATYAATYAPDVTRDEMFLRILNYGLSLID